MANLMRKQDPLPIAFPFGGDVFNQLRLMQWDPFQEFGTLPQPVRGFMPTFDVRETGEALVIQADLPGLCEEDLDISLSGNRLTISGEREAAGKEGESLYAIERAYGSFTCTFALPREVDPDQVRAELKDGVLQLTLPKKAEPTRRRIPLAKGK